ncbi:acyl-CoA dehydrogenase [Streptomyces sp. NPDC047974]|uniref:acyl-CoA dehydrogenase family protein n=1 Tax=Streptomyces sp. NPDC047974 TaxID=3154343 RepID=UPI003408B322
MDFRLDQDQRDLVRGVRELLAGRFGREALRAAVDGGGGRDGGGDGRLDRGLWKELGEAGFFALRLPEERGGVGLGLPEAVLVFEEAGRALVPGPLVATHVAAGSVRGAAEGAVVVTEVSPEGLVPWLEAADVVLGSAEGAVSVRSVDPLTPLHRVPGTGEWAPETVLLTAAEQVGTAAWCTDAAVAYATRREQFGQVIGGFQAVKHLCAGMLVRTELARAAVHGAAVTADPVEIAGAKLLADEAAVANARDCLQVHGGMGFTWEADVHLHLKRAWVRAALVLPGERAAEEVAAAL